MISVRGLSWAALAGNKTKAILSPYGSGYKIYPLTKGRSRYYKTFGRAMKALKKYEEAS